MKKVFVGVCNSQDTVPASFFWSMISQLPCEAKVLLERERHPWDILRNNRLIEKFLTGDCDYFAKTDVDQVYPPHYFRVMVPLVEEYKVIGPVIFDRWPAGNFMPLVNWDREEPSNQFDITGRTGIEVVDNFHTNCFFHREVLEKIPAPWYEAHATPDGLKRANHVDLTFLGKVQDAGYKLYVNYDMVVSHIAQLSVSKSIYERWNANI